MDDEDELLSGRGFGGGKGGIQVVSPAEEALAVHLAGVCKRQGSHGVGAAQPRRGVKNAVYVSEYCSDAHLLRMMAG